MGFTPNPGNIEDYYLEAVLPSVKWSRAINSRLQYAVTVPANNYPYAVVPLYETEQAFLTASSTSQTVFVADTLSGTYVVAAVSSVFGTTSTSGTLQVEVAGAGVAVGSGTNQLTGAVALSGTANTAANGTLITTPTLVTAGMRINLILAGTLTGLANCVVNIVLQRVA